MSTATPTAVMSPADALAHDLASYVRQSAAPLVAEHEKTKEPLPPRPRGPHPVPRRGGGVMATPTKPAMPPVFSDDFGLAMHRETRDQVPAHERTTCPVHLTWRDHCHSWH